MHDYPDKMGEPFYLESFCAVDGDWLSDIMQQSDTGEVCPYFDEIKKDHATG